jgi:putative intracellular protease/amidase
MSKVLVVCAKRYNGHELWTLLGVLQKRGHSFEVVSQELLIRDELTLRPNTIQRTVYQVSPLEAVTAHSTPTLDGIVVVSGNMSDTEAYWTDDHLQQLLRGFQGEGKMTSAICCSVPTLAPIAQGKRVSFFPLVRSRQRLEEFGAVLQTVSLTVDGKMATAENQMLSEMWAEEIINILEDRPPKYSLVESGYTPKGHERKMSPEVRAMIDKARANRNNGNHNLDS